MYIFLVSKSFQKAINAFTVIISYFHAAVKFISCTHTCTTGTCWPHMYIFHIIIPSLIPEQKIFLVTRQLLYLHVHTHCPLYMYCTTRYKIIRGVFLFLTKIAFPALKKTPTFKLRTTHGPDRHMVLSLRGILEKLYCGICEIMPVHAPSVPRSVHGQHRIIFLCQQQIK